MTKSQSGITSTVAKNTLQLLKSVSSATVDVIPLVNKLKCVLHYCGRLSHFQKIVFWAFLADMYKREVVGLGLISLSRFKGLGITLLPLYSLPQPYVALP